MAPTDVIVALAPVALGAVAGATLGAVAVAAAPSRLRQENHAGRLVPRTLGLALLPSIAIALYLVTLVPQTVPDDGRSLDLLLLDNPAWLLIAAAVLALVGFVDDLVGEGPRGFRGHLSELRALRVTTGAAKLVVGVAAGVLVGYLLRDDLVRAVAAGALVAIGTNVWNALDVVPGRALKWAIVVLVVPIVLAFGELGGGLPATIAGVALGLLPWDLRERGMLGDAGSNPLGFVVAMQLVVALPAWGLVVAAVAVALLQVAAETVTISRLIDAVPPLRWFDRLGRRPERARMAAGTDLSASS